MKKQEIKNSIVATNKSTIFNATINKSQTEKGSENTIKSAINNSIVAKEGSQIIDAKININSEKKKSFWKGFLGGIITSVIANVVWYFIQKIPINL